MIQYRHAYRSKFMLKSTPRVNQAAAEGVCKLTLRDLFDSQEAPLLRYAFSLTGRRAVAEEIVQDVFLNLHERFGDVQQPKAWLMRSVRNRAFNYIRKHKREVLAGDDVPPVSYADEEAPEEMLSRMDAIGIVRQALSDLDENDRKLVKLKYFDGLKYSEISSQTGLSVGNVGYRLHHLLKELAGKLRPLGVDGES